MILTQYEINGEWSDNDRGELVVQTIAEETDAELDIIGQSRDGRRLFRLTMGTGDRTIFISGGVHRSEPASREFVLMKARDMAYDVDGKYADYLANHKVMFVPTVNADREDTRNNSQGWNINRDAYELRTYEMPALMRVVTESDPDIYADFHERNGYLRQAEFITPMELDPNTDLNTRGTSANMVSFIRNEMENQGHVTAPYPEHIIGPSMTVAAQGLLGVITMTPETHWGYEDREYRIDALELVFDKMLEWHVLNKNLIDQTKANFRNNMLKPNDRFLLLNGSNEYYATATRKEIIVPEGYILDESADFSLWQDVYKIEVDENRFVPITQPAGRLLPHLLDPESDMVVVSAVRVEPEQPPKRTDGRYTKVLYDEWREVFIKYM